MKVSSSKNQKGKSFLMNMWHSLKERKWNIEAIIAIMALLYNMYDNSKKDKENNTKDIENRREMERVKERDSKQIAILTQTFLDSRKKEQENREELRRIRYRDSVQLAIQIERNNLETREFLRIRRKDEKELASLNNQLRVQKLTNRAQVKAIFPSVNNYKLARPRPEKETVNFVYSFQLLNTGKSDLKNLKVKSFMIFRTPKEPSRFKALPLVIKNPDEYRDLLVSNSSSDLALGVEENTKMVVDRHLNVLSIEENKNIYIVPPKDMYMFLEFTYNDIYGDQHKYYRVLSYDQNYRYDSDEHGAVQLLEFISPKKNLINEIKNMSYIIQNLDFDYNILVQTMREENTQFDSFQI